MKFVSNVLFELELSTPSVKFKRPHQYWSDVSNQRKQFDRLAQMLSIHKYVDHTRQAIVSFSYLLAIDLKLNSLH